MNRGILLLASFTLTVNAQVPLEEMLPALTARACEASGSVLEPLAATRFSAPGYKARLEFSGGIEDILHQKDIPEAMPSQLEAALLGRRLDFEQIHRSLTTETNLSQRNENVLRQLAEEAQRIVEESFKASHGRDLTPLIVITTNRKGELGWALMYLLLADRPAFSISPTFSAALIADGRLFVRIVGRDLDRAHLGGVVAAGLVNFGIKCAPLLERNLPPPHK